MKYYFRYSFGLYSQQKPGFFVNTEKMLKDSAADLADALTKEAEQIGSEGNKTDVEFADKLEKFACGLDDIFKD